MQKETTEKTKTEEPKETLCRKYIKGTATTLKHILSSSNKCVWEMNRKWEHDTNAREKFQSRGCVPPALLVTTLAEGRMFLIPGSYFTLLFFPFGLLHLQSLEPPLKDTSSL